MVRRLPIVAWLVLGGRHTVRESFAAWACGPAFRSQLPLECPMAATIPSAAFVLVQPAITESQRLALAGYLAG